MSQDNQNQNQNQNKPPAASPRTVTIRMKPGCGRAMIGRKYKLLNGDLVNQRPKTQDEVVDTVEEWLEQGKTATVPITALSAYLDDKGRPQRLVEGYPMVKVPGDSVQADPYGNPIPPVHDSYHPGTVKFAQDNTMIAFHADCPFEIVPDTKVA